MAALLPELVVIGMAVALEAPLALFILRESAMLDREQGR